MALLIILLFLPVLFFFLFQKLRARNVHFPPGPRGLPLIGILHQFDSLNPHLYFMKLSKQYGPIMFMRLGFVPTLVISSAKMAEKIMKTHDLKFSNRPNLTSQQMLSYNGSDLVFSPYNDFNKEMRKIFIAHLFNSNKSSQDFRPIREDEVSRMIEKIATSAAVSKPVNINEMVMFLTSTIISRITFGKRYEDGASEKSKFQALFSETQALFVAFFFSDYFPFLGWVDKLTGRIARLQKTFKEFDTFYEHHIQEHLDPNRPKTDRREDIIDALLQIRKENGFKLDLSMDNIKAMLMDIFLDATDTSSASMVWAMTHLMKSPAAMSKVQEEIRSLIGDKGFVDEDDLQRLPYLKAVVKETMRLQPIAPLLIPRQTSEKCIIDGYEIPAKTFVYVNVMAIGRDPEYWPDKTDEFYPDRFVGSCIEMKGTHFGLIPFGAGRRMCPGVNMGITTLELALANLLYKFDWEMPVGVKKEDLEFQTLPGLTMHKKNALLLMARNHK